MWYCLDVLYGFIHAERLPKGYDLEHVYKIRISSNPTQFVECMVLLLPDGDDPDSFAQTHTSEQVEEYLQQNEVDFIKFKMDILLKDCDNDPVKRSKVLGSILQSIANIPVELTRSFYVKECALRFGIQEAVLLRQLKADIAKVRENAAKNEQTAPRTLFPFHRNRIVTHQ